MFCSRWSEAPNEGRVRTIGVHLQALPFIQRLKGMRAQRQRKGALLHYEATFTMKNATTRVDGTSAQALGG